MILGVHFALLIFEIKTEMVDLMPYNVVMVGFEGVQKVGLTADRCEAHELNFHYFCFV